jgi:zinc protease
MPSVLGELLDAASSLAFRATLEGSEIDKELRVLSQEMRNHYDLPASVAFLETMRAGFPAHPYRFAMLGSLNALGRLTSEPLTAFYKNLYVANNMVLALVGDLDPQEAMNLVEAAFGKEPRAGSLPEPTTPPAVLAGHNTIEQRLRIEELWTTLAIVGPGFRHPDRPAFEVIARALASPARSPLLPPLRRTSAGSLAHVSNYLMEDASLLYIALNPITPQLSYTAAQAAVEGLLAFKKQPLTESELRGYVEEIVLGERLRAEDISTRAERLGEAALFGGVRYYWDLPHVYDQLEPADVKRVADRYLVEENLRVVVLLPENSPPLPQEREEFFHETLDKLGSAGEDLASGLDAVLYPPAKAARVTADAWGDPRSAAGLADPQRMVLANGLTVIVLEDHRNSLAASSLHLGSGSGSDPEGKEGMANLNMRLLASATASRWFAKANPEEPWVAVRPEMHVSRDLSEVRFRCNPAALPAGLEALAGAVRDSAVPSANLLDQARDVALAELDRSQGDPANVGLALFREQVYAGHRYAHSPVGTVSGLKAVSPTDLGDFRSRGL